MDKSYGNGYLHVHVDYITYEINFQHRLSYQK